MLDQQHNVMLYGISSRGVELADRYRDLAAFDALPLAVAQELHHLASERQQRMDALRLEVIDEGGLPKAGNPDREFLESLADRLFSSVSGCRAAFDRLSQAEQLWHDDIAELSRESWPEPLAEILIDLSQHSLHCQQCLQKLADCCD